MAIQDDDPKLYELVKTYQIHSHSKAYRKVEINRCRFNFGRFFSSHTVITKLIENVSEYEGFCWLKKQENILSKVKVYIKRLPHFNNVNTNFNTNLTIPKMLAGLQISSQSYYWALSVISDSRYQIHFKRIPDS